MVGFPLPFTQLNWTSVYPAQTSLPSQLSLSPQGTGQVFRVALPNQPGELCNQSTQFCPCLAPFLVEGRGGYFSQRHPPALACLLFSLHLLHTQCLFPLQHPANVYLCILSFIWATSWCWPGPLMLGRISWLWAGFVGLEVGLSDTHWQDQCKEAGQRPWELWMTPKCKHLDIHGPSPLPLTWLWSWWS